MATNHYSAALRLAALLELLQKNDNLHANTACKEAISGPVTDETVSTLARAEEGAQQVLNIYAEIKNLLKEFPELTTLLGAGVVKMVESVAESSASVLGMVLMTRRVDFGRVKKMHADFPELGHPRYYWALCITLMKSLSRGGGNGALHVVGDIYFRPASKKEKVNPKLHTECIAEVLRLLTAVENETRIESLRKGARAQCDRIRAIMREAERANSTVVLSGINKSQITQTPPSGTSGTTCTTTTTILKQRVAGVMRRRCAACGALAECLACGACRDSWYCNAECQKAHWKVHRTHCKAPAALASSAAP